MVEQVISELLNVKNQKFAIITHDNPDGDAIGSAVALENILHQLGKEVSIFTQTKVNKCFGKLLGKHRVGKIYIPNNEYYDVLFILDCSNVERISISTDHIAKKKIVIDHHASFQKYGDIYWCENVVSVGILLYQMIKNMPQIEINPQIATALYVSIRTDTFDFRNANVTSEVHTIVADLLQYNIDMEASNDIVKYPKSILDLQKEVWDNLRYDSYYKILYVLITKKQIDNTNSNFSDASSIIDIIKYIKDVDVAIVFIENKESVYIKIRSDIIDVAEIMQEFNGGGHKSAAGAMCYTDSSYSLINRVLSLVKEKLDNRKKA